MLDPLRTWTKSALIHERLRRPSGPGTFTDSRLRTPICSSWCNRRYGLTAFGGVFTGLPNLGFGLPDSARDWRIGWRLTPAARGHWTVEVNLDAT